jgi:hypothetical protein
MLCFEVEEKDAADKWLSIGDGCTRLGASSYLVPEREIRPNLKSGAAVEMNKLHEGGGG